jgi:molybdate transport system permease protein
MLDAIARIDWTPLRLSFFVALAATAIALAIGLPCAWLLARRQFRGRTVLEALGSLPLVLPPTVLGYYLLVALGRRSVIGRAFESVTGSPITFTLFGAVIASTVHAFPLLLRTARAAISDVDPRLEDAARTLGSNEWRVAFTVTLPLARGGIVAATTLAFARALGEFGVTLMVAGNIPGRTRTAALAIYDALQAGRDAEAEGMALVLTALALVSLLAGGRWSRT